LAVLELKNVIKKFGEVVGVGPISFRVEDGEFLSLLGPSGCGKTTCLRCIAGFEDLTEGTIEVDEKPIDHKPPNKRDIGMVFQQHALFPHLKVFDNVAFGLKLKKLRKTEIKEKVASTLRLVELEGFEDRYPQQLSGGQQQRVALARTLVMEPSILLFDEPLSNLDLKLRIQMRNQIKVLQRKLRKTSIYVTHDQGEALALSDRIVVIAKGKIQQIGTPKEIYEHPGTSFVANFIGESNIIKGTLISDARDGFLELRTDRGMLLKSKYKTCRETCSVGNEVFIAVRLNRIRIGGEKADSPNTYTGRVDEIMYLGEGVQFIINTDVGHRFIAVNRTNEDILNIKIGDQVDFSIHPSSVKIIRCLGDGESDVSEDLLC
jgi:ABC-type Fe3+/spermidine/putrescine transport system ATPase subunit